MAHTEPEEVKSDEALRQATLRFVKLRSPECGVNDHRAHQDWLSADPANVKAFAEIEMLWRDLGPAAEHLARDHDNRDAIASPAQFRNKRPLATAAAAAFILVCAVAAIWWEWRLVAHASTDRAAAAGTRQSIIPADSFEDAERD